MKVYVVTEGVYSDRRIVGVLSSKEKAEEYCSTRNDSDYNAEAEYHVFELDVFTPEMLFPERKVFCVIAETGDWEGFKWDAYEVGRWWISSCNPYAEQLNKLTKYSDRYEVYVYGLDMDHAIKVAQDLLSQKLAEDKGVM